eukprot:EG_transcript_7808
MPGPPAPARLFMAGRRRGLLRGLFPAHCGAAVARRLSSSSATPSPAVRVSQPLAQTHPHLLAPGDLTPGTPAAEYAARRERMAAALPEGSVLILPAHPTLYMTHDIPYAFRQESNFHFLSGLEDPDCLLCLAKAPGGATSYHLVVQPMDDEHELWHGPRANTAAALEVFGCDAAHTVDQLTPALKGILGGLGEQPTIYYHAKVNDKMDDQVMAAFVANKVQAYIPAGSLMQQVRRYKSPADVAMFQRAADISAAAFRQAFRVTRPGLSEHHIFNVMEFEVRLRGAQHLAYPPVVAGGPNGLALHYITNKQLLRDGDLLLVDAGAEYHYYTSDVTRTWPVNGRFSPAQRVVYEAVLDVNQQVIAAHSRKRTTKGAMHDLSVRLLTEKLIDLKVLRGTLGHHLQLRSYAKYYPHSIGHPMGWDIHEEETSSLAPNMIVTVEPGLYLPLSEDVPREFRGIAIRIEDNLFLTEDAPLVLTRQIPKSVEDIERAMAEAQQDPLAEYVSLRRGF